VERYEQSQFYMHGGSRVHGWVLRYLENPHNTRVGKAKRQHARQTCCVTFQCIVKQSLMLGIGPDASHKETLPHNHLNYTGGSSVVLANTSVSIEFY
jgi:hypothetical protein